MAAWVAGWNGPAMRRAALGAAFLLVLLRLLPTQTMLPSEGLDGGWSWALSRAVALGMRFGRDIVFTYGPYGPVLVRGDEPALRGEMVAGGAVLGLAFAGGLAMLQRPVWALAVALALGLVRANEGVALLLPVPAMVACIGLVPDGGLARWQWLALGANAVALGLLPLTKISLALASVAALGVLGLLVWRAGAPRCAAVLPCLAGAAFVLAWLLSGQHAEDLPAYASNGWAVISGYNLAMENPGLVADDDPALLAVAGMALLALVMLGVLVRPLGWRAGPVWAGMATLVFTVWKLGVTRGELPRLYDGMIWLGVLQLVLASRARRRVALVAGVAGILALVAPVPGRFDPAALVLLWRVPQDEANGAWRVVFAPGAVAHDYAARVERLDKIPFAVKGSADIYSFGQSRLLASQIAWSPRPALQSYAAYTPRLAQLDRAHMLGPGAPDNVFFRPEPIDGRLASLEDGLSWPLLLSAYKPAGYDARTDYLWLRRETAPAAEPAPGALLVDVDVAFGGTVKLPDAPALWAWIDARPTRAGRVQAALYRLPQPRLLLGLDNGGTVDFNAPVHMLQTGFLLSPLVTKTADFMQLRQAAARTPGPPRVRTLSLRIDDADHALWRPNYHLRVAPITFPPAPPWPAAPNMALHPVQMPQPSAAAGCALDDINGGAVTSQTLQQHGPLLVSGWAAYQLAAGVPSVQTMLVLRNTSGAAWAVPAFPMARQDVAFALKRPALVFSGFRAAADPSRLPTGIYDAWLLLHHGAGETACATPLRIRVGGGRGGRAPRRRRQTTRRRRHAYSAAACTMRTRRPRTRRSRARYTTGVV